MRVELVARNSPDSIALGKLPALVGHGAAGDIHLDDPVQGSYHCLISQVDDHLVVWNLGTGGSTCVNGARVTKASLKPGDTLSLSGTEFSVRYEQSARRYMYGLRC